MASLYGTATTQLLLVCFTTECLAFANTDKGSGNADRGRRGRDASNGLSLEHGGVTTTPADRDYCVTCCGSGEVGVMAWYAREGLTLEIKPCPDCNGTGRLT